MNYIYDILLNFNDTIYDFYDWNTSDNIINIRKIPLFKIGSNELNDIKENKIVFDELFLNKIYKKTELFSSKDIKYIDHGCLFSDGVEVIALSIKNNHLKKSRLLIDEEIEVLEVVGRIKDENIFYKILKSDLKQEFKTRKDLEIEKMIKNGLNKLKNEDIDTLKYIYFECFNIKNDSKDRILSDFYNKLDDDSELVRNKLYSFFKLIQVK